MKAQETRDPASYQMPSRGEHRVPSSRAARATIAALSLALCLAAVAFAGTTERVSVNTAGAQGNEASRNYSISGDGRCVAVSSAATNLVPDDTNGAMDVFVRDRLTQQTNRVSVSSAGEQANGGSNSPAISADGPYVAFVSWASNLVPGDTNECADVFVHDLVTGQTSRVSVSSAGAQSNDASVDQEYCLSISANGRYVAFEARATNLVPDDTNESPDVFIHDRETGRTIRVSVSDAGAQGDGESGYYGVAISVDGRCVAFASGATNLVPGDTNDGEDVFVRDLVAGRTGRVSVSNAGEQGDQWSTSPCISADGRFVAFQSSASNLVVGDTDEVGDVLVHDRVAHLTKRASVNAAGEEGNGESWRPSLSGDGRYLAFHSQATNLVAGDSNSHWDIFLRDLVAGQTIVVSVDSMGTGGNGDSWVPMISTDGSCVAFRSEAKNLIADDTNWCDDVFVRVVRPKPSGPR